MGPVSILLALPKTLGSASFHLVVVDRDRKLEVDAESVNGNGESAAGGSSAETSSQQMTSVAVQAAERSAHHHPKNKLTGYRLGHKHLDTIWNLGTDKTGPLKRRKTSATFRKQSGPNKGWTIGQG
ncbi:hypothetical protein RvY_04744-2 [Ramazzottius varieornatus]|uniref:Uncharacterized protein n=1 Tax=Ramazzottius varieornatus TaxID=947166 RepID=A0A1D1UW45_RAMVA|nr:hypothetical protein RvY_04744-2 [Ramazzottius varieornatus]